MSEKSITAPLVQVTSVDVLLNNDMRISWQGFRSSGAKDKNPTKYFTTLPGDGSGSTRVSLIEIGAQGKKFAVELTLLNGSATLDGAPLQQNQAVLVPGFSGGQAAKLIFKGHTCSLMICPQRPAPPPPAAQRSGTGGNTGQPPPPPLPGGSGDD